MENLEVNEQYEVAFEGGSTGDNVPVEEISVLADTGTLRPFATTPFSEYTVTEGLLCLVFVILCVDFFLTIVRRWF